MPYRTVEISLPNMDAAKMWMIDNQLGRRNLTEASARYLRGMRMELEKDNHGGVRGNQYTKVAIPQIEGLPKSETAERLATQYKVSRATIERDADYTRDINTISAATDHQGQAVVAKTEGIGQLSPLASLVCFQRGDVSAA